MKKPFSLPGAHRGDRPPARLGCSRRRIRSTRRKDWREIEDGGDAEAGRIVFNIGGCKSCHATPRPTRSAAAWRRAGIENARSARSIRPIFRPTRRTGSAHGRSPISPTPCMAGVSPDGRALLSRASLYVLPAHEPCRRAQSDGISCGRCRRFRDARPPMARLSLFDPPRRRLLEAPLSRRGEARTRSGEKRPNGISAAISSKARDIAPNATPRAIFSGALSPRAGLPAARRPTAKARRRT